MFIYVSAKELDKPEVRQFVEFMMTNASKLIKEVNYLPLPDHAYKTGMERFKARQIGTAFDGHSEVGMNIEDLLKRKPK